MNEHVSAATRPIMVTGPDGQPRPLRFDPDGCSIGPEVPEDLLVRWRNMLAHCGAAQARLSQSYQRSYKDQEAYISVAGRLIEDAGFIADDIRSLINLFEMALSSEGIDEKLIEALQLVANSMLTMADRLDGLAEQSEAARKRYGL